MSLREVQPFMGHATQRTALPKRSGPSPKVFGHGLLLQYGPLLRHWLLLLRHGLLLHHWLLLKGRLLLLHQQLRGRRGIRDLVVVVGEAEMLKDVVVVDGVVFRKIALVADESLHLVGVPDAIEDRLSGQ